MHDQEKSDLAIVAGKSPNEGGIPATDAAEPRAGTKGNANQQTTLRTQSRARVTQALGRVRQAPERRFAVTHPR
jgi:RNA-directed DNA polymerase